MLRVCKQMIRSTADNYEFGYLIVIGNWGASFWQVCGAVLTLTVDDLTDWIDIWGIR